MILWYQPWKPMVDITGSHMYNACINHGDQWLIALDLRCIMLSEYRFIMILLNQPWIPMGFFQFGIILNVRSFCFI